MVVGGLSEQKQRRQLANSHKRPIHVLVGTPGRLCELMHDDTLLAFQDLSRVRFLVVDEVDRVMEVCYYVYLNILKKRVCNYCIWCNTIIYF